MDIQADDIIDREAVSRTLTGRSDLTFGGVLLSRSIALCVHRERFAVAPSGSNE